MATRTTPNYKSWQTRQWYQRTFFLVAIMMVTTLLSGSSTFYILYQTALEQARQRLKETTKSQVSIINAVARFDENYSHDYPEGARAATIHQIKDAHSQLGVLGKTGEFMLARQDGNNIIYLLNHDNNNEQQIISITSEFEIPMRKALSGESGIMISNDYRGEKVLAAYEPIKELGLGIVAKMDLAEIKAPYTRSGMWVLGFGTLVVGSGIILFFLITNPMLKRLLRNEAGMIEAQEIAKLGSWKWNIITGELRWSDQIYRIFGLEPRQFEATYDTFMNTIHPDDRQAVQMAVQASLEDKYKPYHIEHRICLPSGEVRTVDEVGEIKRDEKGSPIEMIGTVQDVSRRKKTEESLLLAHRAIESATDGIIITNLQGKVIQVNPAFEKITGFSQVDAIGKRPRLGRFGKQDWYFLNQLRESLLSNGSWEGEIWDRKKTGEYYPIQLSISTVYDRKGHILNFVLVFSDITEQKENQSRLEQLAYYDHLTGLPNRFMLQERLSQQLSVAKSKGHAIGVCSFDLDQFKYVNDTLGQDVGDRLLCLVAERIKSNLQPSNVLARLGGDEFAVILDNLDNMESVMKIAQQLVDSIGQSYQLDDREIYTSTSVGISIFPRDGDNALDLLRNAELAMSEAKTKGRRGFQVYTKTMNLFGEKRLELEKALHEGIRDQEFVLYYQPKIDITSQKIVGAEALVRWVRQDGTIISPANFIPLAEDTGLIIPIGEWVMQQACLQTSKWLKSGMGDLKVAVNLSVCQFQQKQLIQMIESAITQSGLPPTNLEIEITESAVMGDVEAVIKTLNKLKALNIKLAIDDFGTGYSSLSYLKRFPIDTLKIDQSFVRDLTVDPDDASIVSAVISIGKSLNLNIVAEGVETEEQLNFLREQSCDLVQGYYFSKPLPAEEFEAFLKTFNTL